MKSNTPKHKKTVKEQQTSTFVTTKTGETKVVSADRSEIDTLKNDPNIKSVEDSTGKKLKEQESDVAINMDYVGKMLIGMLKDFLRDIGEEISSSNYQKISNSEIKVDLAFKEGSNRSYTFKIQGEKLYINDSYLMDIQILPSGEIQIPEEVFNSSMYRYFENDLEFNDLPVQEMTVRDKMGIPLRIGDMIRVKNLMFEICFDSKKELVYLLSGGKRIYGGTKNFNVLLEHSEILTDELIAENVEVGDKVRIGKGYGGGRGTVVDKKGEFIVLDNNQSYPEDGVVNISRRLNNDLDVGHVDDEPGMLSQTAYETAVYAARVYKLLKKYEQLGQEVDFPNWWQSKLILSKDYISKASHWLDFATKQGDIE
jgi:hypothetical protein